MKTRSAIWAVLFATAATIVPATRAQLTEPLRVGNVHALADVFERKLDGPAYASPARVGARVDVFTMSRIGRPAVFLTNTFVGADAEPGEGFFSFTIPSRPPTGTVMRVVAYDAAFSNQASYFRSASLPVPASGRLLVDFGPWLPMAKFEGDTNAAYADALDRMLASGADSDGDGMSDWEEVFAGTSLEDSGSLLAFEYIEAPPPETIVSPASDEEPFATVVTVQWQSVPGRTYQLQHAPSLLPDPETGEVAWENVGLPITAEDGETSILVEVELEEPEAAVAGHFRLKLVL